eukprot:203779_1
MGSALVVDVLSVKEYAENILSDALEPYPALDIICTHPMFGPESGKTTWKDLPFVYHKTRIDNDDRCSRFLAFFETEGCRMINMPCSAHDAYSAGSQFITHFTGRILSSLDISDTPINTKGYESLLALVENTTKDSFDLFYALFKYNRSSHRQLSRFARAFDVTREQLLRTEALDENKPLSTEISFNPLVEKIKPSGTMRIHDETLKMIRQGIDVKCLVAGELDCPPPPEVTQAVERALAEGHTRYTPIAGTAELKEAVCEKLRTENGLQFSSENIVITNGGKQAIYQSILVLCRPGDEVLLIAPHWTSYKDMVLLAGATPVILTTRVEDDFKLDARALRTSLNAHQRARLLMICYPNNPSGTVYCREELESFAEVLHDFPQVYILSDEIYEPLIYDKSLKFHSFASLPRMKERTLTVNGFSKSFAMTGFRLGYLAASLPIVQAVSKVQSQMTGCASSLSQAAGVAALKVGRRFMDTVMPTLHIKRELVVSTLSAIPHICCPNPAGAFYVLFDISHYLGCLTPAGDVISDTNVLCQWLVNEHKVAMVPGTAFSFPSCVRISFAVSMEILEEALNRLTNGFSELRQPSQD